MAAGSGWRIDHVTVRDNAGAGVMLGSGNVLAYSCLKDNGEYGFEAGGSHITVKHNEIVGNNADDWETRQPGCVGGAKFENHITFDQNNHFDVEHLQRPVAIHGARAGQRGELGTVAGKPISPGRRQHHEPARRMTGRSEG